MLKSNNKPFFISFLLAAALTFSACTEISAPADIKIDGSPAGTSAKSQTELSAVYSEREDTETEPDNTPSVTEDAVTAEAEEQIPSETEMIAPETELGAEVSAFVPDSLSEDISAFIPPPPQETKKEEESQSTSAAETSEESFAEETSPAAESTVSVTEETTAAEIAGNYGRRAPDQTESEFAQRVFELTNAEREKEGLPPFGNMDVLDTVALTRAWELSVEYRPDHTRPSGSPFVEAFNENGIIYGAWGENIAAGQDSPESVVEAWMNSPSHRAAILNPDYTYMGTGCYYIPDDYQEYFYFWTQEFYCY